MQGVECASICTRKPKWLRRYYHLRFVYRDCRCCRCCCYTLISQGQHATCRACACSSFVSSSQERGPRGRAVPVVVVVVEDAACGCGSWSPFVKSMTMDDGRGVGVSVVVRRFLVSGSRIEMSSLKSVLARALGRARGPDVNCCFASSVDMAPRQNMGLRVRYRGCYAKQNGCQHRARQWIAGSLSGMLCKTSRLSAWCV